MVRTEPHTAYFTVLLVSHVLAPVRGEYFRYRYFQYWFRYFHDICLIYIHPDNLKLWLNIPFMTSL